MAKDKSVAIGKGTINTEDIYNTHRKLKEIVDEYKNINTKVSLITNSIDNNWVGKGASAFSTQYACLISKIDDFGDVLYDIYDALVKSEAEYESADDEIRKVYVKSMSQ